MVSGHQVERTKMLEIYPKSSHKIALPHHYSSSQLSLFWHHAVVDKTQRIINSKKKLWQNQKHKIYRTNIYSAGGTVFLYSFGCHVFPWFGWIYNSFMSQKFQQNQLPSFDLNSVDSTPFQKTFIILFS